MSIKIFYFASLRESLGQSSESLDLPPGVGNVADLRDWLAGRGNAWLALRTKRNLRFAVNQVVVGVDAPLSDGDEVAFFPPVTGG